MSNLIKLSDVLNDATKYTVEEMLHEAFERIQENKNIKKALILFLDETKPLEDQILWHSVGMTRAEHFRLLSNAKDEYLVESALSHTHE